MLNKVYEKVKKFITETYLIFTFYLVLISFLTYNIPYYIITGGGIIDTTDRVEVNNSYQESGKFYFSYVSQLNATIPTYLIAKFNNKWDIEKVSDYMYGDESIEDIRVRDKIDMDISNSNAIYNAYRLAGVNINLLNSDNYIIYIDDRSKNDLKIGDIIVSVDGKNIKDINDLRDIINTKDIGNKISIRVKRNDKYINCYSEVYLKNDAKVIGIAFENLRTYDISDEVNIKFNNGESGPSAGLMLALTIYNKLTSYDLTNSLKIVGTGTMEGDGSVGEVGGIKYKFEGAIRNNADIFIVPSGDNYKEVLKIKNENNYDIILIEAKTLENVVDELKSLNG